MAASAAPLSSLFPVGPPNDKRQRLSLVEELLSIPYLSQRSVMSFLRQDEAVALRAASRACRDAVAEHAWEDFDEDPFVACSRIRGSGSSAWRRCFPNARAANISQNRTITDADFVHLKGIRKRASRFFCLLVAASSQARRSPTSVHSAHVYWETSDATQCCEQFSSVSLPSICAQAHTFDDVYAHKPFSGRPSPARLCAGVTIQLV